MRRRPEGVALAWIAAHPDATLQEAIALILEHRISCLPVVDEQSHPVGIVTWRDLLKALAPDQNQ